MDGFPDMTAAKAAVSSEQPDPKQHDDVTSTLLPLIPIDQLPPRPWAYGRFLLLGSAAVIGAVDGGGKGVIATGTALSMISGKIPARRARVAHWTRRNYHVRGGRS